MVAALGGLRILIHSQANIMPFGNAIVLSMAVTYATNLAAGSVLIGLHADDAAESKEYQRPFVDQLQSLAESVGHDVKLLTPFLEMSKSEVFDLGSRLGVDYSKTWSCIRPGDLHCGYCGACRARARALQGIGMQDETVYARPGVALASAAAH
jgi:7-cyano-7-deazaguanine synthase